MHPKSMARIVNRQRYNTETATLIASDAYWDGHNFERSGSNRFLYRTPKGAYFLVTQTQWQGQRDSLEPIDQGHAIQLWEDSLTEHETSYEDAFPGVEVEDA